MRELAPAEIDAYVATGEPMGKAGAYAIQESGDRFVVRVDGPFDNVVGLPVDAVRDLLAGFRIQ
jgi:septum formation protein